ncbi:hypothetical protein CBS101457_006822 [Exobasidium rhododendri]|nr:hypothetical protein CBS101457_006822 [Exobasidium rhododendri]
MASPKGNAPLRLHQRCKVASYGRGEILFVGQTSFSHGLWVGIALDEPKGKNDGSIQDKVYFDALPGHGVFVRTSQVETIDDVDDDDEEEERIDEIVYGMEEDSASLQSPPMPSSRTSAGSSRTPSRATSSPNKATVRPRTSLAMRPPSSATITRPRVGSPSKPTISRSPVKTPARGTTSQPMSRTNTGPTGSSNAPRPASTMGGRIATVSTPAPRPAAVRSITSTPARTTMTAASRNNARSAVQAAKAPDTATARAGLRPVMKARASMAPPSSSSAARVPRTPTTMMPSRPGSSAAIGPSRSSGSISASETPIVRQARATTTTPAHQKVFANEDEGEQYDALMADGDDGEAAQELLSSTDSGDIAALANQQEEGLTSPSLRKGSAGDRQQGYMSLSSGPSLTNLSRTTGEVGAVQREVEELKVKLKIAEKKREEDREKIKEAERIRMESEQFLAIKPKMTAKQVELQDQLKDLHKMEKDWTLQREDYERQISELSDTLEITALDREVAEEKAEGALEELRIMTDKVEEMQVDIEVLREENALYEQGPIDDKEKLSIGYIQLEKQNERLKDALVRLRDMSVEGDADQKRRIAVLEKDLSALDDLQASYESVCTRLESSDALLEDLKIQLDDALGAEEMLEQLTERNLVLTEKLEEMSIAIEDLEALRELNDELEETHLETEKQLQEEVDLKDIQLREHRIRTESLEGNIVEYENTFGQFRELVMNLQSEVQTLRDDDKARDAGKSSGDDQAMLNLNLKLQSSTLKSQAKTIELEIGKLQAQQATTHLEMISPYLPKEFFEQDKDACESLLFFQRIAAKTDIIKTIVEGNHDIASSLIGVVEESLIKVCKMRHSLAHFIVLTRQISAEIQLASIPTFLKSGRMYKELTTIEKRIDHFIEQLREEALNEEECGKEYNRFVNSLDDFDFALMEGSDEGLFSDLAAKELGSAILFDLDLDTIAAALGFSKQNIAALYNDYLSQGTTSAEGEAPPAEIEFQMNELDINDCLFQPIQDQINNIRSTKVPARKLLRRLATLNNNSEAVKMDAIEKLPSLGRLTSQLVQFSTTLVTNFSTYTNEVRVNKSAFELNAILQFVQNATGDVMLQGEVKREEPMWALIHAQTAQLSQTVGELLGAATEQENVIKITGPLPWIGRVEEIKRSQSENVDSQRIIVKQTEDLKELYKQTKFRDEALQENTIKIERLNKQVKKSKEELLAVEGLKSDLSEMTRRMKAYEEGNSALQGELEQLQREYERVLKERGTQVKDGAASLSSAGTEGKSGPDGTSSHLPGNVSLSTGYAHNSTMSSSSLEASYLNDQLEAVRGALRYLRMENNVLKSRDVLSKFETLPRLLSGQAPPQEEEGDGEAIDPSKGIPRPRKETIIDESMNSEGRKLMKELMRIASCPRVVSLTPLGKVDGLNSSDKKQQQQQQQNHRPKRSWTPMAKLPQTQLYEQTLERSRIQRRIQSLHEKISTSSMVSLCA